MVAAAPQKPLLGLTFEEVGARILAIADELEAESPLKNPRIKRRLAEQVARLHVHLERITEEQNAGTLPPEIARTIPAVASQILRHTKAMGLTEAVNDPAEEDL